MEIRIKWTNLKTSAALEDYFRHKIEHLEHYYKPILSADLELAHDRHHRKGEVYRAEARLAVAKKTIYASQGAKEAFESVDLLLNDLINQIADYKDKYIIQHSKRRNLKEKTSVQRRYAKEALRAPQN